MSLETRSNSALFKRAEQLKRWDDSETNKEPHSPKRNHKRIKFTDGCVFLAACSAGDKEEVKRMLEAGADINTANVDGLTALHQACIDDNLDMVEFLVEHGADINCGDNEGWTPLHATASCGFLSIASFLIEKGANVAAVNNDGELPLDIAEINEMEQLLQEEVERQGINCDEARHEEERLMMEDATDWLNAGYYGERSHPKTGATALHVAAAKGYSKVIKTLIDAGADLNAQDYDGWTPLHAAAHWNQREACEILASKLCNMDIKNYVGQTVFDVADPDVLPVLEELKKKQSTWKKDPEIQAVLMRRPQAPLRRRTSVTRMSGTEKTNAAAKSASLERQVSLEQAGDAPGKKLRSDLDNESDKGDDTSSSMDSDIERKSRTNRDALRILPPKPSQPSSQLLRENVTKEMEPKQVPNFKPREPVDDHASKLVEDETPSWRKAGSFRNKERGDAPKREESNPVINNRLPNAAPAAPEQPQENAAANTIGTRRIFNTILESDKREPAGQPASDTALLGNTASPQGFASLPTVLPQSQVRRSFVPPVRDEESETQRKAHAKRVRETRRSTQGVTLDDIKAAQQTIKQQNQTGTTGVQEKTSPPAAAAATVTVTASALPGATANSVKGLNERRPSWKLTKDDGDRNKFQLEDARLAAEKEREDRVGVGVGGDGGNVEDDENGSAGGNSGIQSAIQRKRRPKRRSTGVVHFDPEDPNAEAGDANQGQYANDTEPTTTVVVSLPDRSVRRTESASVGTSLNISDRGLSRAGSRYGTSGAVSSPASVAGDSRPASRASENGEVDYKKLYEESMVENERLRGKLKKTEDELGDARMQVEKVLQMQTPNRNALSDVDKRERRALERKLSEMEEELKMLEQFKTENQRLRDENGALIRVISKLSK